MNSQASSQDISIPIRVLTHNIRTKPLILHGQEEKWETRRDYIMNELHFNTINNQESIICLQEALHEQLEDVLAGLTSLPGENTSWTYVGCGREGGESGEYSPILYRSEIWKIEDSTTLWLSAKSRSASVLGFRVQETIV